MLRDGAVAGIDEPDWTARRRRIPRAPADVTLYLVDLPSVASWAGRAVDCLDEAERDRALSLRHENRREEYLISRVVLRHVLARSLATPPAALLLTAHRVTGAPKPVSAPASGTGAPRIPLHYSLARAPGRVAVATGLRPVGVDLETRQSPEQAHALLRLLHPADRSRLRSLPARRRARAVTDAWVRLEALQKARGVGLSVDPSQIRVGTRDRERHSDGVIVTRVATRFGSRVHAAVAWHEDPAPLPESQ